MDRDIAKRKVAFKKYYRWTWLKVVIKSKTWQDSAVTQTMLGGFIVFLSYKNVFYKSAQKSVDIMLKLWADE